MRVLCTDCSISLRFLAESIASASTRRFKDRISWAAASISLRCCSCKGLPSATRDLVAWSPRFGLGAGTEYGVFPSNVLSSSLTATMLSIAAVGLSGSIPWTVALAFGGFLEAEGDLGPRVDPRPDCTKARMSCPRFALNCRSVAAVIASVRAPRSGARSGVATVSCAAPCCVRELSKRAEPF